MAKRRERKEQQDLKMDNLQLRTILDAVGEGVIATDMEGKVTYMNRKAEVDATRKIVGMDAMTMGEALNIRSYPDKAAIDPADLLLDQTLKGGNGGEVIRYADTIRGKDRILRITVQPIQSKEIRIGTVVSYRDITRRRTSENKLIESEQRYRSVVERMNEGMIIVDDQNLIQFVNNRFCEMLGYDQEELLGKLSYKAVKILNISDEEFAGKIKARRQGKHEVYNVEMLRKDGVPRWFKVSASPVYDADNQVIGSMGIHSDISDQYLQAEENERLLTILDSTTDYVWLMDDKGAPIYLNTAMRRLMGIKKGDDISVLRPKDFYTKDSAKVFKKEVAKGLSNKGSWYGELTLKDKRKSAKRREVPTSEVIVRKKDKNGKLEYTAVIARDISEIKLAQREIAILARMPEEEPSPVLRVAVTGVVEYANPASQILLKQWKTRVGKPLPEVWSRIVRKVVETGHHKEYETDIGRKIFDLKVVPVKDYDYVNIFASDITHRKKADQRLRDSEQKYRAIVEDQTELITRYLADGTITFANKAYCRYYDHDPEKIVGKNLFTLVPRELRNAFRKRLSELTVDNPVITYSTHVNSDDNPRWQLWTDRAIYDDNDLFIEYQSVGQDITGLKQAELDLRRQEIYLRKIIDTLPNLVYVKNESGQYRLVNKAFSNFLGEDIKNIIGRTDADLFGKSGKGREYRTSDQEVLSQENTFIKDEDHFPHHGGEDRWFHTVKTPLITEGKEGRQVLGVSTDITDRKRFEDTLQFQLQFKELISNISTQFINLGHTEIDACINDSLQQIGEFSDVDRVMISLVGKGGKVDQRYGWVKDAELWAKAQQENPNLLKAVVYKKGLEQLQKNGYLYVRDTAEITNAKDLKNKVKTLGIKSFLTMPLQSKKQTIGFLSLSTINRQKEWTEDTIALFRIVSQVFSNAMERKHTESLLNFTLGFENIITTISANFINIKPGAINKEIIASLKYVAQYLDVDQGYVLLSDDDKKLKLSHYWLPQGIELLPDELRSIESGKQLWALEQLKKEGVLAIPSVDAMPKVSGKLKADLQNGGVKSLIGVPIIFSGKFTGALIFGSFEKEEFWSEEAIPLLKIFGQILANALDRKRTDEYLTKSREQYRTLARNIPKSAVMLFDKQLRYQLVEGAALEDQGYSREDLEGKTIYDVLSAAPLRMLEPLYKEALNGKQTTLERDFNGKHFLIHILPVKNEQGETYAGMVMSLDISDLHNIQQQLKEQTDELMRSNEDLELFAYAASHDLQEPLRMVSSYVHLIQRKLGQLDPEIEEFMNYAVDGVKRMQELINDLLEYSRVDRKGHTFQQVDMAKVMQLVEINLRNAIAKAGVTLKIPKHLPRIVADQSQMISLFQNIIENGVKFSAGNKPYVQVGFEEEEHCWRFFVKDNGIGIESKFFERIFIIFQRLNSRKEFEGTGIGLAICKKIVDRHKGQIWVESDLGTGTTFYVELSKQL